MVVAAIALVEVDTTDVVEATVVDAAEEEAGAALAAAQSF